MFGFESLFIVNKFGSASARKRKMFHTLFVTISVLLFSQGLSKPIQVTEENWSDVLQGEWMLEL